MYNKGKKQGYPYAWLDEVIEVTLNPKKANVSELGIQQLLSIESKFDQELQNVLRNLKSVTFYLFSPKKIKAIVTHFYDSLRLLEQQAMENLAGYDDNQPLAAIGENLVLSLQNTAAALKKRYGKYVIDKFTEDLVTPKQPIVISKILCKLSVDQIGIILKAADDAKLIIASSISVIFRSIVPFLSTENMKNISWNSMRKSTYHIEQIDKDVAIATLEKLILIIKDY
ncbi:hypothetical protein IDJ77_01860 [Mucilaginibacter sp. ZT4R22]|uniref:Uncharacterized protein n=1 Tax=Mucilaginibacter pankratovii TaxID=2772110 RepID=A0ABR7WJQ0_9SPHI|nr:hypothetical protein [Mucilaginibacter pankratovii]MBD1362543.1 hypothetical protein [Mucilaginibacter pankratovii]